MSKRILVTYASRTGSAASYADVIGRTLAASGLQVDVIPMQAVTYLAPYQAFVVGSAVRKSRWLPEAVDFIKSHQAELKRMPLGMFTVSITLAMSSAEQYQQAVRGWIAPVRAMLNPLSDGLFPGMLDFSKLPFSLDTIQLRLAVALGIFPKEDRRDFEAARAWATNLAPLF